jgi:eukaryotic-like serine/threonine-protein kinase
MNQINCLRCKQAFDANLEQCPSCGDRVTSFQRTYSTRLIDGKYQILDRLGVGGMGEIFKVRHIHLNELRVIKIMRPNVAADDQGMQRFLQEARTSTMIKHRNLAMLYDFAQLDDGSYYMVWEFIDGTNIQKWISQNGPVPPRLTVEIAVQALHGLDHLHSMGLIHRDISPENIMLSQDHHGKLLVKVIDFGIAKSLAEGESGQGLTQTGMFLGKLKYASPEQAGFLKEGEHLDARSDLYSFGIVMYEMLAGRAPFQATNPHGYILKHVTERPAAIADTNPDAKVPSQLESIIFKSLEKSRDSRQRTAAEFAAAIEGVRGAIPPDQKYGLGEKMVTLSAAKTLADLPKYTQTSSGATTGSSPTQLTMGGGDQATVLERNFTAAGTGQTIGSNDATVIERIDPNAAQPTVLERQITPPKSRKGLFGAIAAAVILAIALGVFFMNSGEPEQTAGGGDGGTIVDPKDVLAPTPGPGAPGVLLLSASPWGDIEKIINASNQQPVTLSDDKRSTPARLELDPGRYQITLRGPASSETIDVEIESGKVSHRRVEVGSVKYDELIKAVKQR